MGKIDKCICFHRGFDELQVIAKKKKVETIEELQEIVNFGQGCQMCIPYIEVMLQTGETEFDPCCYALKEKKTQGSEYQALNDASWLAHCELTGENPSAKYRKKVPSWIEKKTRRRKKKQ